MKKKYMWNKGWKLETDCNVRGPKSQIVSEKLHDQSAVLVGFLTKCVQLWNSLIESLKYDISAPNP